MHGDKAFLKALVAHPDDDVTRLVYADWLDEQGDPARAEYLRADSALAGLPEQAREGAAEAECLRRLRAGLDPRWVGLVSRKYDVVLTSSPPHLGWRMQLVKVLRSLTGLGLRESMDRVGGVPCPVRQGVPWEEAEDFKGRLLAEPGWWAQYSRGNYAVSLGLGRGWPAEIAGVTILLSVRGE